MPRTVQITLAAHQTDEVVREIQDIDGLISLHLQRGISLQPRGDVVSVEVTNRALQPLMNRLIACGIGQSPSASITTNEPISIVSSSSIEALTRDTSEATWEEMEAVIAKESNATGNTLILMGISGLLATIGIATNALHIVIAAMLIAPGFEPITRVGLGTIGRSAAWRRGLSDTMKSYSILVVAAAVTTLVLRGMGKNPLGGEESYLPAGVLISYWTSITLPSLVVTAAASIAGALLISTNRSVLTGGVMIALALIPAATLTGMGVVAGDWGVSSRALMRWIIEVSFVCLFSIGTFAWKQWRVQKRKMLM